MAEHPPKPPPLRTPPRMEGLCVWMVGLRVWSFNPGADPHHSRQPVTAQRRKESPPLERAELRAGPGCVPACLFVCLEQKQKTHEGL
uniref:Uncharacterized protein n=1 Tax=Knipowitschia caucasica TaxID=637954 RepID=A0AAV2M086_KNICA